MFDAATIVFLVLSILGGQVAVPLFLATCLLSKRVHRHPLLLGFMFCWVIYSLATCILLYSGQQGKADYSRGQCLAQAAMINGSLIMAAVAAFALVLHLRLTMPRVDRPFSTGGVGPKTTFVLCVLPPLTLIIYLGTLLGIERSHPGLLQIEQRALTCGFSNKGAAGWVRRISPIIAGILLIASLVLSSFMFKITYARRAEVTSTSSSAPWLRILLRFLIFSVYSFLTAIACVLRLVLRDSMTLHTVVTIYVATLPLAAVVVFGSLPDVIGVWICWRRPRIDTTEDFDTARSTTVPWDTRDPDEVGSLRTSEGPHRTAQLASAWDPRLEAGPSTATPRTPQLVQDSGTPSPTSTVGLVRKASDGSRRLLKKASGSLRKPPTPTTGLTGDGPSTNGEKLQRPHLAEAYYAGRIAQEYYAEKEEAERLRQEYYAEKEEADRLRQIAEVPRESVYETANEYEEPGPIPYRSPVIVTKRQPPSKPRANNPPSPVSPASPTSPAPTSAGRYTPTRHPPPPSKSPVNPPSPVSPASPTSLKPRGANPPSPVIPVSRTSPTSPTPPPADRYTPAPVRGARPPRPRRPKDYDDSPPLSFYRPPGSTASPSRTSATGSRGRPRRPPRPYPYDPAHDVRTYDSDEPWSSADEQSTPTWEPFGGSSPESDGTAGTPGHSQFIPVSSGLGQVAYPVLPTRAAFATHHHAAAPRRAGT